MPFRLVLLDDPRDFVSSYLYIAAIQDKVKFMFGAGFSCELWLSDSGGKVL